MKPSVKVGSALALLALAGLSACDDNTVINTVPRRLVTTLALSAISPSQGALASNVQVMLTGTGFVFGATTVNVSGTGVVVSDVQVRPDLTALTVNFAIQGDAALGPRFVTFTTAGGTSNQLVFTIIATARFIDLGTAIRDTLTNLVWEKKTPAGSGGLHDVATKYSWCAATGNTDAGSPCVNNTTSWIASVNGARFGGFNDWRVPTQTELQSILASPCPGDGIPCIDPIFGPTSTTTGALYWSSTAVTVQNAALINFVDGAVTSESKLVGHLVRAVRTVP